MRVAALKSCPCWSQLSFTFEFQSGRDLDPRESWKEKEQYTCSEGSIGDSWRAKGAWKSTEHIYKLKFLPESLSAPHGDQFLPQKCGGKLLGTCWKHVNKSITYLSFSLCHLQWQSAPKAEPCYFAIVLWIYDNGRGITGAWLPSLPSTSNTYKYMLKDNVVLLGKKVLVIWNLETSFLLISCGAHSKWQWHIGTARIHEIQRAGTTDRKSRGSKQKVVAGGREGRAKEIKTNGNAAEKIKKCSAFRQRTFGETGNSKMTPVQFT